MSPFLLDFIQIGGNVNATNNGSGNGGIIKQPVIVAVNTPVTPPPVILSTQVTPPVTAQKITQGQGSGFFAAGGAPINILQILLMLLASIAIAFYTDLRRLLTKDFGTVIPVYSVTPSAK